MIIALPYAGGNIYSYNKIDNLIVPKYYSIDRIKHNISEIDELIDYLMEELIQMTSKTEKYYIYGHSMGGLVGFLLCKELQKKGMNLPAKLIVSGRKAPEIPKKNKNLHILSDQEFLDEIIPLGGIPVELLKDKEILEFFIPIIKNDFKILDSYHYTESEKLTIPIDVFYGSREAEDSEMQKWRNVTTSEVQVNMLEGNHFFLFEHIQYFKNYFNKLLTL